MQRGVEMEFAQLNQWLERRIWFRHVNALNIGRRPDPETFALAPDAPLPTECIAESEMKTVQLYARMETIGKSLYHLLPDEWLGAMGRDVDEDNDSDKERKDAPTHPERPAGYASAWRCADLSRLHLFWLDAFLSLKANHFLIRRPMN
jgi:hypothetical protein